MEKENLDQTKQEKMNTTSYDQLMIVNTQLLVGEGIEEPIQTSGGLITYSEIVKDPFSNLVVVEDYSKLDLDILETFYKERGLPLAIAINENKLSPDIEENIKNNGFKIQNRSAYMVYNGEELTEKYDNEIALVDSAKKEDDYITVFNKVFCEGEGVYGGLSTDYLEATRKYFKNYPSDRRLNYVSYSEGIPVATTSFLFNDEWAVIIGVATLPEFRGRGLAKSMIKKGIEALPDKNIFLGTETQTENEEIYKKMGFETKFVEAIFVKEQL